MAAAKLKHRSRTAEYATEAEDARAEVQNGEILPEISGQRDNEEDTETERHDRGEATNTLRGNEGLFNHVVISPNDNHQDEDTKSAGSHDRIEIALLVILGEVVGKATTAPGNAYHTENC